MGKKLYLCKLKNEEEKTVGIESYNKCIEMRMDNREKR